ncbi:MAG: aminopeptidase, partial [Candidatus Hydrothermarchaeota archaeon]|nr:aminopeptidase [Candidatus Hydrothermarchaeota archaeon]
MLSNVLKTCLNIRKNEVVLIVTDDNKLEVAAELESAARRLSGEVLVIKMKPRSHHAEEPPEAVADAMRSADV